MYQLVRLVDKSNGYIYSRREADQHMRAEEVRME